MDILEAKDEYYAALRRGQKEYKELLAAGKSPYPAVLDRIIDTGTATSSQMIGLVEIPAHRIVENKKWLG